METVAACKRARKRPRADITSEDEQDGISLGSIRLIFASGGSSPRFDDGLLATHSSQFRDSLWIRNFPHLDRQA